MPTEALSQDELTAQFNAFSTHVINGRISPNDYFSIAANKNQTILRSYIKNVKDIQTASIDELVAYQEKAMNSMNLNASRFMGVLKNIAGNLLFVLGTQLAINLTNYIWENLPFTEKHKQKVAEYADKATQALNERIDKNISDTSAVEEMTNEFKKLSAGVSSTGENLSLTNSQYDTYKSYVEQLISINPSLVQGINAQGDAFINNKTAIEETTKALKEQQRAVYASFFNGSDNENVLENLIDEYEKQYDELYKDVDALHYGGFGKNDSATTYKLRQEVGAFGYNQLIKLAEENSEVAKLLGFKAGEDIDSIVSNANEEELLQISSKIVQNRERILDLAKETRVGDYNWGTIRGEQTDLDVLSKQLTDIENLYTKAEQQQENLNTIIQKFDDYANNYARSRTNFYELSERESQLVDDYIKNYNFGLKITDSSANQDFVESQMRSDINKYIDFLASLQDEVDDKIYEITSLDKSKLSYSDYKAKADELIKEIVEDPSYDKDLLSEEQLRVQLGVDFETDDGEIENEYENMIDNLVNRFERKSLPTAPSSEIKKFRKEVEENLRELTPDEILKLYNAEDLNIFSSWDRAKSYVDVQQGFDIETYKESIEEVTKDLKTLGEAYKKIKEGKLSPEISGSTEEVMGLVSEFDELNEYVDYGAKNFGNLEIGLRKVIKARPDKLIISFKQLGNLAAKDAKEVDKVVEALRNLVDDALGDDVSFIVGAGLTESDYLQYVTRDYDKIIKSLEKQKEATEEVNDALEEQKEKLDEIVDNYETAGNTVIKTIEDKIDDVTKFYDEQIDRLKEENDELERNIDLQEKRDNLANARKTKLHVYSETQGWYYTTDKSAIKKAEDELAKSEREVKIADLEKERDAEIKLWEEYKEAWQDAMDSYTKAHDEAITEGILGVEWREKVIERDEDMLDTYQQNYSSFKDQLDDSIDEQIKKNKEYVNSIDKKIKEYQKDIDEMKDWVEEQESQKLRYFELIDDIKITENSTWEQRLANFKEFKENWKQIAKEIAEINDEPEVPENPKLKLTYQGNNLSIANSSMFNQEYSSKEEALQARTRIATQIRNERLASIPKNLQTSALLKRLLDEILDDIKLDTVGSYAHGGVIDYTGLANVHGSSSNAEVALSSSQARTVYDFIASGALSKATAAMSSAYNMLINALPKPSLNGINLPMSGAIIPNSDRVTSANKSVNNELTISFPNATINAKDYDTFKKYMDTYTNDLMLKMQVGL